MCVSHVQLFATPWTIAHYALLTMEFSRQEYWSGWPIPFPWVLPDPGIEPRSPVLQADSSPFATSRKTQAQGVTGKFRFIGLLYLQKSRVTLHTKINFKASTGLGDISLVLFCALRLCDSYPLGQCHPSSEVPPLVFSILNLYFPALYYKKDK